MVTSWSRERGDSALCDVDDHAECVSGSSCDWECCVDSGSWSVVVVLWSPDLVFGAVVPGCASADSVGPDWVGVDGRVFLGGLGLW